MEKQYQKIKRNIQLDWLGGFFIIHMILGHISQSQYASVEDSTFFVVVNRLFFFFMPWFFFKSGMFFRANNYREFNKKSFKRLMIPFIFFSIIGEPLYWIHLSFTEHATAWQWYLASIKTIVSHGQMQGNGPLWFLFSLFLIRIFYNRCCKNNHIKILCIFLFLFLLCYLHTFSNVYPSITHTLAGFIYFSAGDLMKNLQYNRHVFLISLLLFLLIFIFVPIDSYVLYGDAVFPDKYYNYIYIYSLTAIIVYHNVFRMIPTKLFQWFPLQNIGKNSMIYYVTHILILNICRIIFSDIFKMEQWPYFGILIIACIATLPLLAKIFQTDKYKKFVGA